MILSILLLSHIFISIFLNKKTNKIIINQYLSINSILNFFKTIQNPFSSFPTHPTTIPNKIKKPIKFDNFIQTQIHHEPNQHSITNPIIQIQQINQNQHQIHSQQSSFYIENSFIQSQHHAQIINPNTLLWKQNFILNFVENTNLQFEIYNILNSSSNPEQSQILFSGKIQLNQNQNSAIFDVFNSENKNLKIGSLHVQYQKAIPQNKSSLIEFQKVLSSIKISLLQNNIEKGYVSINNTKKILKSEIVNGQKGQFNFYLRMGGKHLIKSSNNHQTLSIQFFNAENQLIGTTKFSFQTENNIHKQSLINKQGKKIGDIFFEISKQKISQSRKTKRKNQSTLSSMTMSKIRSLSQANFIGLGQSQFMSKPRHKRIFIMHHNNDIVMSSEKRFQLYQDKQSQIISYSKLPSMKFEEQQSRKYYRGASIGNGHKTNFTEQYKSNPGVGQYKLPSIFDRY